MKKSIFKAAMLAVLAMPVFTACELDQYPTTSIPNEQSWEKFSDATNFNIGIHSYIRGICGVGWYTSDLQADYYQPGKGYLNNGGTTYDWSFTSRDMGGMWSTMFTAINQANNFLNNCEKIPVATSDSLTMAQYKAEAYFLRAFAYSQLAIRYCADYDPATADKQLGLPLVTTVDVNARPARASLKATFEFIKADLASARKYIQNTDPSSRELVSTQMLNALEARVDLYHEDYANAVAMAKSLIDDSHFGLETTRDGLFSEFENDEGKEFIFVPAATPDDGGASDYSVYHNWISSGQAYSPYFLPSQTTIDAYDVSDIRRYAFFEVVRVKQVNTFADNIYVLNKFPGNASLNKTGADAEHTYLNIDKPFRIAEQYLIAAEASYRLGNTSDAQNYLNTLRQARGLVATTKTGTELFQLIKDEWFREFIGEGQRLDGLKRWGEGFSRKGQTMQNGELIMQANKDRNIELTVDSKDQRFVWEIPYNDLLANKNLQKNWK